MKKRKLSLLLFFVMFISHILTAQDISNIATLKVDELSDAQIEKFWVKAQGEGYDINKVSTLVRIKGMPMLEVEKLKERIRKIELKSSSSNKEERKQDISKENEVLFGLTGKEEKQVQSRDSLFGYDFFNNPKISFIPNINVATPSNYQLGPGDIIQIDVWGAAEANYEEKVNKQGNIKIQGIGVVNLGGLSLELASSKIKSYLKRIYAGINAPKNSYNKVYSSVTLSKVRTVQVNVIGEVKTPGTYSLSALSTVLNALYAAGGPTKNGTFREVSLVRYGKRIGDFDIYKYLINGSEEGNLQLQDQDVIIVKPYTSLVTINGQVKRPGKYELIESETMKNLIDFCGGFTSKAYKDIIVIERFGRKGKEVRELSFDELGSFKVLAGDEVNVREAINKFRNRVLVSGAVFHPGSYELKDNMTILDLLNKASGVKKEAFLDRALLIRAKDELDKEVIAFSIPEILNKSKNIQLQSEDEVYIYTKDELRGKRYITVNGAVNNPQQIDFMEGMSVEDVIALSGGLKVGADPKNIEVSRRMKDGSFEVLGESFTISSTNQLQSKVSFALEPFDVVSVRYIKGYTVQKNVKISGEIKFPGDYSISQKDERISDLIKRAGGLSPYAYIKGATLIRKKIDKGDKQQQEFLEFLKKRDSLNEDVKPNKKEFRIGINLAKILENKKNDRFDLILQEGDELFIPSEKQTIEVQGEVYSPSLVRYVPGKSLKYYVDNAGGFSEKAKKGNVYVLYSNGNVDATNSFLGFRNYPKIEPGATILVPKKEKKNRMSAQEIIGISTGIVTLGVLIERLVK